MSTNSINGSTCLSIDMKLIQIKCIQKIILFILFNSEKLEKDKLVKMLNAYLGQRKKRGRDYFKGFAFNYDKLEDFT